MMDVFDPARHKIVAIDNKGRHFHVTLPELAMDMSKLDFKPFFDRMRELEAMAAATPVPTPAVDLTPVEERLTALEGKPASPPQERLDLSPVLDALSNLAGRVSAIEGRPEIEVPDMSPLIEELARTADARHIEQERALQALAQAIHDLNHRVSEIEAGLRDQLNAAQRRLSA